MQTFPNAKCPTCKSSSSFDYYDGIKGKDVVRRTCSNGHSFALDFDTGKLVKEKAERS
jgi:hypothetical protein